MSVRYLIHVVVFCVVAFYCFGGAFAAWAKAVSAPKSNPAKSSSGKKSGWKIETMTRDFGLCKFSVNPDGFRADYPIIVLYADLHSLLVTVGAWETQKSFTFPMDKTGYYLKSLGVQFDRPAKSKFEEKWELSPWVKTRDLKIGDLPVTEYERHVLNPPPGRTRTHYQLLAHVNFMSPKFYKFYNAFAQTTPAEKDAFVVGSRVVITNPPVHWSETETRNARKTMLSQDDVSFPKGFQKVETISEMFLNEDSKSISPEILHLKEKLPLEEGEKAPRSHKAN